MAFSTGFGGGGFGTSFSTPARTGGGFGSTAPGAPRPAGFGTTTGFGGGTTGFGGASTSTFGASAGAFRPQGATGGFGASPSAFGTAATAATTSAFGANRPFGATTTTTGFGAAAPAAGGFGSAGAMGMQSGFGAAAATQGTGNPPFRATPTGEPGNPLFYSITAMDAYKHKSFEELRMEDYQLGRKTSATAATGATTAGGFGQTTGGFGAAAPAAGGFGAAAGGFGAQQTGFGAARPSGFGSTATSGFGAARPTGFGTAPTSGFGGAAATPAFGQSTLGGGFGAGAARPAGFGAGGFGQPAAATGGFGQPATGAFGQPAAGGFGQQPAAGAFGQAAGGGFGQQSGAGGFGQTGGGFGQTAASTSFGAARPTGFGTTGTAPAFGAGAAQTAGFGAAAGGFGAPRPSGFGTGAAPAFGSGATQPGGFGQQPAAGGFGQPQATGGFGQQPAAGGFGQPQAAGGFGAPRPTGFGAAAPTTAFGQAGATTGGFGAPRPAATTSFGFPQTNNAARPTLGFGQTSLTQPGTSTMGGFGQQAGTTGFGTSSGFGPPRPGTTTLGGLNAFSMQPGAGGAFANTQQFQSPANVRHLKVTDSAYGDNPVLLAATATPTNNNNQTPVKKSGAVQPRSSSRPRSGARVVPRGYKASTLFGSDDVVRDDLSTLDKYAIKSLVITDVGSPAPFGQSGGVGVGGVGGGSGSGLASGSVTATPVSTSRTASVAVGAVGVDSSAWTSPRTDLARQQSALNVSAQSVVRPEDLHSTSPPPTAARSSATSPTFARGGPSSPLREERPLSVSALNTSYGDHEDNSGAAGDSLVKPRPRRISVKHTPILTGADYYTEPPIETLQAYTSEELSSVSGFTVGRHGVGWVKWDGKTDVRSLNLDNIVKFRPQEIVVYPNEHDKPERGQGLNRPALVQLNDCWMKDKHGRPVKDPEVLHNKNWVGTLKQLASDMDARFVSFDETTGVWQFRVEHFSRYGLRQVDDEEEAPPVKAAAGAGAAVAATTAARVTATVDTPNRSTRGLSLLAPPSDNGTSSSDDDEHQQQQASEQDPRFQDSFADPQGRRAGLGQQHGRAVHFQSTDQQEQSIMLDVDSSDRMSEASFMEEDEEYDDDSFIFANQSARDAPPNRFVSQLGLAKNTLHAMNATLFTGPEHNEELDDDVHLHRQLPPASPLAAPNRARAASPSLVRPDAHRRRVDRNRESFVNVSGVTVAGALAAVGKHNGDQLPRTALPGANNAGPVDTRSLLTGRSHMSADASLFMNRSFRVGWGPAGLLALPTLPSSSPTARSEVHVAQVYVRRERHTPESYEDALTAHLRNCSCAQAPQSIDVHKSLGKFLLDAPQWAIGSSEAAQRCTRALADEIAELLSQIGRSSERTAVQLTYEMLIWDLIDAIFGNPDEAMRHLIATAAAEDQFRLDMIIAWLHLATQTRLRPWFSQHEPLAHVKSKSTENGHIRQAMAQLAVGNVREALHTLFAGGDGRLALVLSSVCSGEPEAVLQMKAQVDKWTKTSGFTHHFDPARLKMYQLLSGDVKSCTTGLDWVRSFSLHLLFGTQSSSHAQPGMAGTRRLQQALASFMEDANANEDAALPLPPYYRSLRNNRPGNAVSDLCYHLLRYAAEGQIYNLSRALCSATFTVNRCDTSVIWHLANILLAHGVNLQDDHYIRLCHGFSFQLETVGLWQWAIFVALHIPRPIARGLLVRELLHRNCSSDTNLTSAESFLIETLKVPATWIYAGKALAARYEGKYAEEASHLLSAGQWNECHRTVIEHLAVDAVIQAAANAEKFEFVMNMLDQLRRHADAISEWDMKGEVFLEYSTLLSGSIQLHENESKIAEFAKKLPGFLSEKLCDRVCRAEMASKLSGLASAELAVADVKTHFQVLPILCELPMPIDYRLKDLNKLTSLYVKHLSTLTTASV